MTLVPSIVRPPGRKTYPNLVSSVPSPGGKKVKTKKRVTRTRRLLNRWRYGNLYLRPREERKINRRNTLANGPKTVRQPSRVHSHVERHAAAGLLLWMRGHDFQFGLRVTAKELVYRRRRAKKKKGIIYFIRLINSRRSVGIIYYLHSSDTGNKNPSYK